MKTCKFVNFLSAKPSFLHADAVVGVASLWTLLSGPACCKQTHAEEESR
jgi:hypothetical protein